MSDNQVNNLLGVTMDKIKQMVDVNTVIGSPVTTPDGTTVIPVSRVSYGFASEVPTCPRKRSPLLDCSPEGAAQGSPSVPLPFWPSTKVTSAYCRLNPIRVRWTVRWKKCRTWWTRSPHCSKKRNRKGLCLVGCSGPNGGNTHGNSLTHSVSPARIGFCEAGDLC